MPFKQILLLSLLLTTQSSIKSEMSLLQLGVGLGVAATGMGIICYWAQCKLDKATKDCLVYDIMWSEAIEHSASPEELYKFIINEGLCSSSLTPLHDTENLLLGSINVIIGHRKSFVPNAAIQDLYNKLTTLRDTLQSLLKKFSRLKTTPEYLAEEQILLRDSINSLNQTMKINTLINLGTLVRIF